jgi:hypothetical protein
MLLPQIIYKQNTTFKDSFAAVLGKEQFAIENERGHRGWDWNTFSTWTESPHFFHLYFNARSFFCYPKMLLKEMKNMKLGKYWWR